MNTLGKFALIALLVCTPVATLRAQDTAERINARILPTVWFSTLEPEEGEEVRVYAAVQNNSGVEFEGEVSFYVGEVALGSAPLSSGSESLEEVSVVWLAVPGEHNFRAVLSAELREGTELISAETDIATIEVEKKLTVEDAKNKVVQVAKVVREKVDTLAESLADKLESTKKVVHTEAEQTRSEGQGETEGGAEVLGASTGDSGGMLASVYNTAVGAMAFLLRHWLWTLSGFVVLILMWSFRG